MSHFSKYSRYVPTWQTVLDIVLANAAFIATAFILDEQVVFEHLRTTLIAINVAALGISPFAFMTHRRRMMRSEKLAARALIGSSAETIILAALIEFSSMPQIHFTFFLLGWGLLTAILVISWITELAMLRRVRRHGRNLKRVVIIGTGPAAMQLTERLTINEGYGIRILGYFDNNCQSNFKGKYLGELSKLDAFVKEKQVADIYYAAPTEHDRDIARVIKIADDNMCNFYIVPLMSPRLKQQFYMMMVNANIPVMSIHPSPLSSPLNRGLKRLFDILFSSTVLLFSPIVFIPVAIAIKLSSPGPVFFKQKRTGYMGADFDCYKFRTMKVNNESDSVQATKDDDRKTRVGNFLRHTSIDELPQFFNVLKGDMSIVGPRPHMLAHTEEYRQLISQYMVRHTVKPGITGWAQVNGFRGGTDHLWQMEKRVDNDVWYIEHWSFLLDLKIVVMTVTNAIKGEENAY